MIPLVIPRFFNDFQESPRLLVEPTLLPQVPDATKPRFEPGKMESRRKSKESTRWGERSRVHSVQSGIPFLLEEGLRSTGWGRGRKGRDFVPRSLHPSLPSFCEPLALFLSLHTSRKDLNSPSHCLAP